MQNIYKTFVWGEILFYIKKRYFFKKSPLKVKGVQTMGTSVSEIDEERKVSKQIENRGGIDSILKSQNTDVACIISGTGSGKSYWIKNTLGKFGRVLYITSRAAKVLQDKDIIYDNTSFVTDFGTICNTVCTNWALWEHIRELCNNTTKEQRMKNIKKFINGYDYIVFDEFHSLVCDSLFSDSIFNIAVFFCFCVFEMKKKTIILTATKQPVDYFIKAISKNLKEKFNSNGIAYLDLTKECEYVLPDLIKVVDKNKKKNEKIEKLLDDEKKFIYFMNFVGEKPKEKAPEKKNYGLTIYQEYDYLISHCKLKKSEVAIIVSRDKQAAFDKDYDFEKSYKSRMYKDEKGDFIDISYNQWVREEIAINGEIPEGIRVILCSATLTEGISIENEIENPFTYAITDAHYISTIIQQMGRLRNNLKEFWIINDARQHANINDEIQHDLLVTKLENENSFLNCLTEYAESIKDIKKRNEFIKWICKKKGFDLIAYSYITHRFEFNNLKYNMINEINRVENQCKVADAGTLHIWEKELYEFAKKYNIHFQSSGVSKELSKLIDIVRIRQHIKSVIDINFYGSEWKKEQALLKDLNLGSTEKTINKKLMSLGMEFQLNKRETYTHGRYVYSFSRYNINSLKW